MAPSKKNQKKTKAPKRSAKTTKAVAKMKSGRGQRKKAGTSGRMMTRSAGKAPEIDLSFAPDQRKQSPTKKSPAKKATPKKKSPVKKTVAKKTTLKKSPAKNSSSRSIKDPPKVMTEVKDVHVIRKFLSTASSVQGLQTCSTWKRKDDRKKKPNTSHFMLTIDEMVPKPSAGNKHGFVRDETHYGILHPKGFKRKSLGEELLKLGDKLCKGSENDKNLTYTQEVDEYKAAIYDGPEDEEESSSDESSDEESSSSDEE